MIPKSAVPRADAVLIIRDHAVVQAGSLLRASPYLPLRKLTCEYHEGVLTIRGRVPTFYLKQLAQANLQKLALAEEINNQVEVVWSSSQFATRKSSIASFDCSKSCDSATVQIGLEPPNQTALSRLGASR